MNGAVGNAREKLDEALFYLKLMDRIEIGRSSLTDGRQPATEFSYLFSAFLNACYSCTEHLRQNKSNLDELKKFRVSHRDFYSSGPNGGLRTQTVHFRPVTPGHDGYIPPPGDNVIIRFREEQPYSPPSGEAVNLSFGPGSFYLSSDKPQNSICDICAVHVSEIQALIGKCSG